MVSMAWSTMASSTAASILVFGRKSTTYSAPRYSSVWPFWRPKPFTSVTVMPCTLSADNASRTSSSLNGLMMAVISFIQGLVDLEGFGDGQQGRAAPQVLPRRTDVSLGVGIHRRQGQRADSEVLAQ